jgi:Tol biopolymer transport system component
MKARAARAYGKQPLSFEANRGQTDPRVKFVARGDGYGLFLTADEAVLSLRRADAPRNSARITGDETPKESPALRGRKPSLQPSAVVRLKLEGANNAAEVEGLERLPGVSNYFTGHTAREWHMNAPSYARVKYHSVYPGIDLIYYGNQRQLEYDFRLAPGASPSLIKLAVAGAERIEIDKRGDLVIGTAGGDVRQRKPVVYQETAGGKRYIAGRYKLDAERRVGFEIGAYDATLPLVIDPVLGYSTLLGGGDVDFAQDIAVDAAGSAYIAGITQSLDFPVTAGAAQTANGGPPTDAYVTKLSPDGSSVVYSTYLGGDSEDSGVSLALDSANNVYLTGETRSPNFPITPGAYQSTLAGDSDVFVTKLDATGSNIIFSTYIGGTIYETGTGIAVDAAGNVYVGGNNLGGGYPTTPGSFEPNFLGSPSSYPSERKGFVTKLNPTGSALLYSTYIGGTGGEFLYNLALDSQGQALVSGTTGSADFPVTPGAYQTTNNGGGDAYVTKLNADGSALVYSTFVGGSAQDMAISLASDAAGNIYLTGQTSSLDFPVTAGAYQTAYGRPQGGGSNAFVTKLNPGNSSLIYSTYLGRDINDSGHDIAVDHSGYAYVVGYDFANGFPITSDALNTPNGNYSAFITKFNANGTALLSSTKFGTSTDGALGAALDNEGRLYVTGYTYATDFPTTPGAFQTTHAGGFYDAFAARLDYQLPPLSTNGKIVFTSYRDGNNELYTMDADGSGQTRITNDPADDLYPAFSPDGTRIAFSSNRGYFNIWTVNADGSNPTQITNDQSHDTNPAWSPDGTRIAYTGGPSGQEGIYVINSDGSNPVRILAASTVLAGGTPAWSPDGRKIAFQGSTADHAAIYVMNADGTNPVRLTFAPLPGGDFEPSWSPDGTRIAFASRRDGTYGRAIFVMNADGTNPVRLTAGTVIEDAPVWSPDGTQIVFWGYRDFSTQPEIRAINADGSNLRSLTDGTTDNRFPGWQPQAAASPTPSPSPTPPIGPPNDNFANAQVVAGTSGSTEGTNVDATVEPGEFSELTRSVWYSWTAPADGQATFTTVGSDFDTLLYAFSGTTLDDLQLITADDDSGGDHTSAVNFPVTAGTTYYLAVDGYGGATGNIIFNWTGSSAPANDNFANAQALYGASSNVGGTNRLATAEAGEPDHNGSSNETSVWYSWTPTDDERAIFDTAGSSFDTILAVYTGSSVDNLTEVVSNDDAEGQSGVTSAVAFDAVAGTTYYIAVTGYGGDSGDITLNWRASVPPTPATRVLGSGQILYVTSRAEDGNQNIYLMNHDGSGQGYLTQDPNDESDPVWSRDTTKVVFSRRVSGEDHVIVMNSDGSNQIDLSPGGSNDREAVWSPDGTKVAFSTDRDGNREVYVMNADGTNPVNISNDGGFDFQPAWSPTGSRIAFRSQRDGNGEIYAVNADGTNLSRLTTNPGFDDSPVWSPDGSKIAFESDRNSNRDLYVMNADGTGQLRLTDGSSDFISNYAWSPDGLKIAYEASSNSNDDDVFVTSADGSGAPVNLSNNAGGDDGSPVWSPDGAQLAFVSDRDGLNQIYLMNADGSNQANLSNSLSEDDSPVWEPPLDTPAGTNVIVTENGVTITFSNVTQAGETTVTPIDPNSLTGVPGEYVINANSLAFEIHTTAVYTGPITLGFQVAGVNNPITFSALRVLHGEPPPVPNFVDRTVLAPDTPAPNFPTRTLYARVTSLSPFLITERKTDTVPPVTTATLSQQPNTAGWHKANVTVTLAATDNAGGSGVQSLTYSATGAQTIAQTTVNGSTAAITVTVQGTTTITYQAKDVAGNVEAVKTLTIKLDKTAPGATTSTVNSTPNSSGYYNGLNGPVAVTLSANDLPGGNASGIAGFRVSATGAQTIPANTFVPASNPVVQITNDGTTTLSYRAVDNADNEGLTATRTLKVDATPPVTSYTVSSAGTHITLTVNFRDNLSGYSAVNFSVNDGQWQVYTGPFPSNGTFSYTFNGPYNEGGSYTIKYYGTDAAGNREATKTVTFTIPPQAITPTLASVKRNANGTYTATFGYRNDNPVTFNIAVGASNNFSPGNQNRGQTTAFQSGTVANAFTVTWDGSSLTWNVKGPDGQTRRVTARKP